MQNINKLRALEGELARSVETIEGVDAARIHLVIPEHQIFSHDDQNPSASVVLKTRGVLGRGQVQAIQHLVAAAVSALTPERVAIVDDKGNLLAGGDDKNGPNATALGEENQTTDFEDRLRDRVESIVASVVGPGHVRVQVTADIAYTHTTKTSETYDPDSKVVRSTQTVEATNTDTTGANSGAVSVATALPGQPAPAAGDNGKSNASRTEETINYEINKAIETSAVDGGTVKKLSVAVVVDGQTGAGGAYKPRPPAEMKQIADLVKSAIGFDAKRGDIVQVDNMEFARMDLGDATPAPQPLLGMDGAEWTKIIEGRDPVAGRSADRLLRRPPADRAHVRADLRGPPARRRSPAPCRNCPPPTARPPGKIPRPCPHRPPRPPSTSSASKVRCAKSSTKKVGEVVSAHPEEALAIIRTWLHEPA